MRVVSLVLLIAALAIGVWIRHTPPRAADPPEPVATPLPLPLPSVAEVPPAAVPTSGAVDPAAMAAAGAAVVDAIVHAHALFDPRRCLADTGKALRERTLAVHRWVDENGITHFSDSAPAGTSRDHRVIEVTGVPPIVVHARGHDVNLPSLLEQRATADAQAIERILRNGLGVDGDPGFVLNIVFVESPTAYAGFVPGTDLAASAGAYSMRDRTIYVRWQPREQDSFTILRHEIAHALVHERVGNLPVAINEGLAGFFERVEVYGLGAQVVLHNEQRALRAATVSADGAEELVDLLAREPASFYADGREVRYLRAFALVAMMMGQPQGRTALTALLAAQRADSCRSVDVAKVLETSYPGGLAALAADWSRWLRDPPPTVLAY